MAKKAWQLECPCLAGGRVCCSSSHPYEPGSRHSRPEDERVGRYKLQGPPLVTYSHELKFMSTPTQKSTTSRRPCVQAQELTGCFKLKRITGPRPLKRCQYHYMRVDFFLRLVISIPFSFRRMLTEMPRNDALLTV